jgi:hypothetical protein
MTTLAVRPDALDYLTGSSLGFANVPGTASWQTVDPELRRLELVRGVGIAEAAGVDAGAAPLSQPVLAGLAGENIPFAFQVVGGAFGVSFAVGTWVTDQSFRAELDQQQHIVTSLLDGLFPSVERVPSVVDDVGTFPLGGIAHGIPRHDATDEGPAPWDRLVRSMHGLRFAVLVLAEPIDLTTIGQLRDVALDDVRAVLAAEDPRGPSPLAQEYAAQVEALVSSLNRALAIGGWRAAVYLLGDHASYWQLSAAWRATFHDADAMLMPLRTAGAPQAVAAASAWAMPYAPAPPGPRTWRHPFLNQTLLDTRQLAAFAHLPRLDTPGFAVRPAPAFAVSRRPPAADRAALDIGEIVDQRRATGISYRLELDQLTRHGFVAGLTGSGKTNTLIHLLGQAAELGVPFLVIEPAKTEYRELLGRERIAERLRVFTLGREHVSPLRINPFEVPPGIDVSTHLDLLKAVFMASFAMWIPLPQVLEQCLVELYTERGWDFSTGAASDQDIDAKVDVPTLAELVAAVERTVPALGYKVESTQEITAALTTRLNALRRGTRGLMLDVERSIPMGELLTAPTIVELEGLGDDADKAFVMGLLLTRLYEHRRAEHASALKATARAGKAAPPTGRLTHLVVVEEAHRLLGAPKKTTDAWHADPQGAFADTFGQMLAEVRAYGQGIIVADQVPVRLAPDVVKNTNLKVVHRLVAGDDRLAMAAAMSMNTEQAVQLAVLPPGRAAVFSEGDHTPVIVQVPRVKDRPDSPAVDDVAVASAMRAWRADPLVASWFAGSPSCAGVCPDPRACREARALAEQPAARLLAGRLFHTAVEHVDGLDVVWPDVQAFVAARSPYGTDVRARVQGFTVHALADVTSRRANQGDWPASAVARVDELVRAVIAERVADDHLWMGETPSRVALLAAVAGLQHRTHDPFPLCSVVCDDGRCRFLHALGDVRMAPRHVRLAAEESSEPSATTALIEIAGYAASDVSEVSPAAPTGAEALNAARWRAVACAAQLMECATDHPRRDAERIAAALTEAGWPVALAE